MRMKGDHRRRPPQLACAGHDRPNDRLMADVHAIEVSDRCDAAAGQVGLLQRVMQDQHWT
jgi:hypothetical protein